MHTIAVCNRKGGCGKSSTCVSMFSFLTQIAKKRTLLLDFDSQCNSSYAVGADMEKLTMYDVLRGNAEISATMQEVMPNLFGAYVIPASNAMVDIDNGTDDVVINVKIELQKLHDTVDYIIIDTPPSLGTLTTLALLVADQVVLPCLPDAFSLQGIGMVYEIIRHINRSDLEIAGILITRYNDRLLLNRKILEMLQETADAMGTRVFDTAIRESVVVREAEFMQIPLFSYDNKLRFGATQDYYNFCQEMFGEGGKA